MNGLPEIKERKRIRKEMFAGYRMLVSGC